MDSQPDEQELYERARAARQQARVLAAQHRAARHDVAETLQRTRVARERGDQVCELALAARSGRLRYSPYARLQAQLTTMPVIEQAKGIIMVQCGWSEDQAFDALRRASQRENVKVRDLAAKIVSMAARPMPAQPSPVPSLDSKIELAAT